MIFKKSLIYEIIRAVGSDYIPGLMTFYGAVGIACNIPYTDVTLTIMAAFIVLWNRYVAASRRAYLKSKDPNAIENDPIDEPNEE